MPQKILYGLWFPSSHIMSVIPQMVFKLQTHSCFQLPETSTLSYLCSCCSHWPECTFFAHLTPNFLSGLSVATCNPSTVPSPPPTLAILGKSLFYSLVAWVWTALLMSCISFLLKAEFVSSALISIESSPKQAQEGTCWLELTSCLGPLGLSFLIWVMNSISQPFP